MMNNTFQVISDIHLEFLDDKYYTISITAPNIILLGDIGNPKMLNYWNFIDYLSDKYENVFLLTGNHEYYGSSIEEIDCLIEEKISQYKNVHFMNNKIYSCKIANFNIILLGTTLWSHIPKDAEDMVRVYVNDYNLIKNFSIEKCNKLFISNYNWLKTNIDLNDSDENIIVVLSHHAPVSYNTSHPRFDNNKTNCAFSNNIDEKTLNKIDYWLYGHTHYNNKNNMFKNGHTTFISNQYGYPKSVCENFDQEFTLKF